MAGVQVFYNFLYIRWKKLSVQVDTQVKRGVGSLSVECEVLVNMLQSIP